MIQRSRNDQRLAFACIVAAAFLACSGAGSALDPTGDEPQYAIFLTNAAGEKPRLWGRPTGQRFFGRPKFSPGASRIAFCAYPRWDARSEVYLGNQSGSEIMSIGIGANPCWTRDATQLFFNVARNNPNGDSEGLWKIAADGGDRTFVGPGREPAAAPDGERMAYVYDAAGAKPRIVIWTINGDDRRELAVDDFDRIEGLEWSSDGLYIAFHGVRDAVNQIVAVSTGNAARPPRVLASGRDFSLPAWRPKSRIVTYYVNDEGATPAGLYAFDLDSGAETLLHRKATLDRRSSLCWSHDDTTLAFAGEFVSITERKMEWHIDNFLMEGTMARLSPFIDGKPTPPVVPRQLPANDPTDVDKESNSVRLPFNIEIGRDEYRLNNTSPHPLRDLLVVTSTPAGRRVGWLDRMPAQRFSDRGNVVVPGTPPAKHAPVVFRAHDGQTWFAVHSPDQKWLATGGDDALVKVWDAKTLALVARFRDDDYRGRISASDAVFTPDSKHLIVAYWKGLVRIWDVSSAQEIGRLVHPQEVGSVAVSPDGKKIATGSLDGARIWDTEKKSVLFRMPPQRLGVNSVVFLPKGDRLATGSGNWLQWGSGGDIHVYDLEPDQRRSWSAESAHSGTIFSIAIAPDGSTIASCSSDSLKLWDADTGKEKSSHEVPYARELAFSPDGKFLALGGARGDVHVWSLEHGRIVQSFRAQQKILLSVAYSPDGKVVSTSGQDNTIGLYSLDGPLPPPPQETGTVKLSPPMRPGAPALEATTRGELNMRLHATGLTRYEADFFAQALSARLFESDQFVVAGFVDFRAVEGALKTELDPAERSRAAVWMVFGRVRPAD